MADDFSTTSRPPLYTLCGGIVSEQFTRAGATKFLIAVETDVPVPNALGYSHPGSVLSSQIVTLGGLAPSSGTYTETLVPTGAGPPSPDGALYQYNAELAIPAPETAGVVEWLKIVALKTTRRKNGPGDGTTATTESLIRSPRQCRCPASSPSHRLADSAWSATGWHFQDDAVTGSVTIVPSPTGGGVTVIQPTYFRLSIYHRPTGSASRRIWPSRCHENPRAGERRANGARNGGFVGLIRRRQ